MQSGQLTHFKKILDENDVYETLLELSTRQDPEVLRKYLDVVSYIDSKSEDKTGIAVLQRTRTLAEKGLDKDNEILAAINNAIERVRQTEAFRIEEAKNIGFGI